MSKLILVIGGTGAQGLAVVDALLKPQADGSPSPYSVRVFTRNPTHRRALELKEKGCELFQGSPSSLLLPYFPHQNPSGSIGDLDSVYRALQGVYGAYVNTDGFTVGEKEETFIGLRIFELAKQTGTIKHYVWSSLDYMHKASMTIFDVTVGSLPTYRLAGSNLSIGAVTTTARDASPSS
jgi:nucleoside-diphosphate-sugar epimerase